MVRELERIAAVRGYPLKLRLDNGPELVSVALAEWAEEHGVTLEFIKPGKPMQNGYRTVQSQLSPGSARHVRLSNSERGAGTDQQVAEGIQRRAAT